MKNNTGNAKKTCFLITPIGESGSSLRRHIDGIIDACIIPALGKTFEISVSHRKYDTGSIGKAIIKEIYNSDIVIANLTGLNANVMYELAIRYCTGKPTIVIAETGTVLPFDISDNRTIFYDNDALGTIVLTKELENFISNISDTLGGPIYDVLGNIIVEKNIKRDLKDNNEVAFQYIIDKLESLENIILDNENETYKKVIFHEGCYGENTVIYNPLVFKFSILSYPKNKNIQILKQDILDEIKEDQKFQNITSINMIEIGFIQNHILKISFNLPPDIYSSETKRILIQKITKVLKNNSIVLPSSAYS